MSAFDIGASLARAAKRLGDQSVPARKRRARADRGQSRLAAPLQEFLNRELQRPERPRFVDFEAAVARFSDQQGLARPSRATLYNYMATAPLPSYAFDDLPVAVQRALYNLREGSRVPAHQVAFAAFNYGDVDAISFAAGLPWLALYQANRVRGWRPKSHALLRAVMRRRGI